MNFAAVTIVKVAVGLLYEPEQIVASYLEQFGRLDERDGVRLGRTRGAINESRLSPLANRVDSFEFDHDFPLSLCCHNTLGFRAKIVSHSQFSYVEMSLSQVAFLNLWELLKVF